MYDNTGQREVSNVARNDDHRVKEGIHAVAEAKAEPAGRSQRPEERTPVVCWPSHASKQPEFLEHEREPYILAWDPIARAVFPPHALPGVDFGPRVRLSLRQQRVSLLDTVVIITRDVGDLALPVLSYIARTSIARIRKEIRLSMRVCQDAHINPYELTCLAAFPVPAVPNSFQSLLRSRRRSSGVSKTLTIRYLPGDRPAVSRYAIPGRTSGQELVQIIFGALATRPFMGHLESKTAARRFRWMSRTKKRSADDITRVVEPDTALTMKKWKRVAAETSGADGQDTASTIRQLKTSADDALGDEHSTTPMNHGALHPKQRGARTKRTKPGADARSEHYAAARDIAPRKKATASREETDPREEEEEAEWHQLDPSWEPLNPALIRTERTTDEMTQPEGQEAEVQVVTGGAAGGYMGLWACALCNGMHRGKVELVRLCIIVWIQRVRTGVVSKGVRAGAGWY
ncbi:hypothetical protein FN846DRAFT_1004355 [Sphaerosporella brunnea]|uniref:Uncharacterized protein n=1 Tax=Sphaerosporella brunnea TaxID=1250544 RepID=A0A5J5EE07_9PEZI|nr:hypothetical protein FN846DRAFT_1004355 [Sphaerosporella brunnea]